MTRIAPWRWDARAAFPIPLICLLVFFQCDSPGASSTNPELVVSPSTGIQGSPLILSITAEDTAFDTCDPFTAASLEFEYLFSEDSSLIVVESVDLVNANTVRAAIDINENTALGLYRLLLRCKGTTTYSSGNRGFEVTGRRDEKTLRIAPPAGGAGARQLEVTLDVSPPLTYTDASYVQFGDGTDIIVSKRRIDSPQVMTVWIDISAHTPQVEQQVVVGTGPDSVYGVFNVTERVEIAIESVVPDSVTKPGNDWDTPLEYWLVITGTTDDVGFIQPGMDGGVDDGEGSRVSFHPAETLSDIELELAGIQATEIQVDSLSVLRAKIAVLKNVPTGRVLVRVTTEDRTVEKSFWVEADAGEPHLRVIHPRWAIERGGNGIDVVVEGVNFDVTDFQSVFFMEVDCTVQCDPLLVSDKLYLKVDVDEDYAAASATLGVTDSGSETATAVLLIRDEDDPKAVFELGDEFPQGENTYAKLVLKGGGEIDSEATAYAPIRSGIRASDELVTPSGELFVRLDVGQDAPLGTAWIRTLHDGAELETPVTVGSSSPPASWISMHPDTFLQGRNQTVVSVQAHGFAFDPSSTAFQFDDPAMHIAEVLFDNGDDSLAQLTVDVSPAARTNYPSNLYSTRNIGGEQAARACRVLATPKAWPVSVQPVEITRQPGGAQQTIDVRVKGIEFDDPTEAFVLDNIGVEVSLVQTTSEDNQRLDFVLKVDENGPGGWIGVLIYSGWQSLVVPINVVSGDDESLTMQLTPGEVRPGSTAVEVLATSPVGDAFQDGTTEVFAAASGAYTTLLEIIDGDEARFYLDTSVKVNMWSYGDKMPIALTARKGAVVGFVEVEELSRYQVSESEPWQGIVEDGDVAVVTAEAAPTPSLVFGSVGWPGYTDVSFDLRAENSLDAEEATDAGSLWILDPATTDVLVSSQGDPLGLPSAMRVKRVGAHAEPVAGSDWVVEDHLCDSPFLGIGAIDGDVAEGRVPLVNDPPSTCRLVVVAIARVLGDRPWSTPDLWLELRENDDTVLGGRVKGWPTQTEGDPRIYFDLQDGYLAIGSELGTAGDYLINIRRTTVINEISRDGLEPFIEIVAEPGAVLDDSFSLALYGADGSPLATYVFDDHTVDGDGLVVIGDVAGADITDDIAGNIPPDAPFALLVEDAEIIDCVQVGTVIGTDCSEGEPIPNDEPMPVFFRVESIDTDDNLSDFVPTWTATPGS
ncbi:MAG: hypothetical protein GY762_20355 [Proteobacteria bacterium]|nr:hypothetical protein [Pseudomonadota bacterium]